MLGPSAESKRRIVKKQVRHIGYSKKIPTPVIILLTGVYDEAWL